MRRPLALLLVTLALGCGDGPTESGGSGNGNQAAVARLELSGTPAGGNMLVGRTVTLQLAAYDAQDNRLTGRAVTWSSSNLAVAGLLSSTAQGAVVSALTPGTSVIAAWCEGQQVSVELRVRDVPTTSVRVSPASVGLYATQTTQLVLTVTDSAPRPPGLPRTVEWRSSHPSVAAVSSGGLVSALAAGATTVTVTTGGLSDSAHVVVLARPVSDWSAVPLDWGTFPADATHGAYLPATLDPLLFATQWTIPGGGGLPAAADGRIFLPAEYRVVALHAASGSSAWSASFAGEARPGYTAYAAGTVYVQALRPLETRLVALDAATGAERFAYPYASMARSMAPVVAANTILVTDGEYRPRVHALDPDDGTVRWIWDRGGTDLAGPSVRDGVVYLYDGEDAEGKLSALDAATGAVLFEIPDPGFSYMGYASTPLPASGERVLLTQNGRLLAFDAAGRSIAWVLDGGFGTSTALAEGVLYVPAGDYPTSSTRVEARRETDGTLLWSWDLPESGRIEGPLLVTRNLLFVGGATALYAVDLDARVHVMTWAKRWDSVFTLTREGQLLIIGAGAYGTTTAVRLK